MLLPGATAFDRLNTGSVQGAEPQAPGDLGVTRRDAGECNERSKASHKGYVKIVLKSCKLRTLNVSVHLVAVWEICSPVSMPRMMKVHEHHTPFPT